MIDENTLKEFNRALSMLNRSTVDSYQLWSYTDPAHYELSFLKMVTDTYSRLYRLSLNCAWEILRDDSVIFRFMPETSEKKKSLDCLENLIGYAVTDVRFNIHDLSLIICLGTKYGIRLLHDSEKSWSYSYRINVRGVIYEIHDETIDSIDDDPL